MCAIARPPIVTDVAGFWEVIRSWPADKKSRLLQFATGTSRIPVNGFKCVRVSLQRV